jgi:hypothetical protein
MKGDFSRLDKRDTDDAAVLLQQGRPLLDSQLNGAVLTVLRHLEGTMAKLSGAQTVAFPRTFSNGIKQGKITPADGGKALQFPSNEIFVRGMRLEINSPHITEATLDGKKVYKATIADKELLGVKIDAGKYVLYVQVIEEAVAYNKVRANEKQDKFLRFVDSAVPSSDSLRLRRFTTIGLKKQADWKPPKSADAKLTMEIDDRAVKNELVHFEFHRYLPDSDPQELILKWSRDNAAIAFAVNEVSIGDTTIEIPELATSMLTVRPGQLVELLGDYPHTPVDCTNRQLYPIKEVDLAANKIVLENAVEDPKITVRLIRIWDGSLHLRKKGNGGNGQTIWRAKGPGFAIGLKTEATGVPSQPGDYWQIPLRIGDEKLVADRQSTVLALEQLCEIKVEDSGVDLTLSELTDVGHEIVSLGGNTSTPVSAIATTGAIRDTVHRSPEILQVLDATSCRGLIARVKSAPVKQWLASLSYAELCAGSESALRGRILRDCEGKLGARDDLEGDLAVVIAERRKLHNDAGLSLAEITYVGACHETEH